MADSTGQTDQASGGQQPQNAAGPQPPQDQASGGTNQQQQQQHTTGRRWTQAEAEAEIANLRSEAASHRTRAAQAEQHRDRLQQQLDTLTAEIRSGRALDAATSAASELRARNPGAVAKLVNISAVEYDKDGQPTNVKALVEALKKDLPELFNLAPGGSDGGAGNGAAAPQDMNYLIRRAAGRVG